MSDREHTVLSNFEIVDKWGTFTTLDQRRFYLRRLVRFESDSQIRSAEVHPGGYDRDTSNLFLVNEEGFKALADYQIYVLDKIRELPSDISFRSPEWDFLRQSMITMSREYKIHLQVNEDFIPMVVSRLVAMIKADDFLQKHIVCFKCKVVFQRQMPKFDRAVIVLYLAILEKRREARDMCYYVISRLKEGLADYEAHANSYLPRWNYPVTGLMSFIQVGTDTKDQLKRILGEARFNQLFPAELYQALLMDEKIEYYL